MFVRTDRLLLRPGWVDDAAALRDAIAHETVANMLATMPWPYGLTDAEDFLSRPARPHLPNCLIFLRTAGKPRLIGGIGLGGEETLPELGFWISPAYWGLGFATEAGRAFLASAQESLKRPRIAARHFMDNPASGHVLRKLGFVRTGRITPLYAQGRGTTAAALDYLAVTGAEADKDAMSEAVSDMDMRGPPLLAA